MYALKLNQSSKDESKPNKWIFEKIPIVFENENHYKEFLRCFQGAYKPC